jgi:hypothetical protein
MAWRSIPLGGKLSELSWAVVINPLVGVHRTGYHQMRQSVPTKVPTVRRHSLVTYRRKSLEPPERMQECLLSETAQPLDPPIAMRFLTRRADVLLRTPRWDRLRNQKETFV